MKDIEERKQSVFLLSHFKHTIKFSYTIFGQDELSYGTVS